MHFGGDGWDEGDIAVVCILAMVAVAAEEALDAGASAVEPESGAGAFRCCCCFLFLGGGCGVRAKEEVCSECGIVCGYGVRNTS